MELLDEIDAAWAAALGCSIDTVRTAGVHLVPGGDPLVGYQGIYVARIDDAVLVAAPAHRVVAPPSPAGPDEVFTPEGCRQLARTEVETVLGPAWHGFVDVAHFRPPRRHRDSYVASLERGDPSLDALRLACDEAEWLESGLEGGGRAPCVGIFVKGRLVGAGVMTDFRGLHADVGVLIDPEHRGKGLAQQLVGSMVASQLAAVGIVRYRAVATNLPSLSVAAALGFIGRGENIAVRLRS